MPNKDKTGPEGKGSLTGRGFGKCVEKDYKNDNKNTFPKVSIPKSTSDKPLSERGIPNRDTTGPHGRGKGPGKGKADGSGKK